jgi:hypothetical protein
MHRVALSCIGVVLLLCSTGNAAVFRFDTDPFAGVTLTPGRDVIGGEAFITFTIPDDVFSLESTVFGTGNTVNFVNDVAANIPAGANVIVLRSFDNDADPTTPFGAGTAAALIASQMTASGPGFFIYFNQNLDLPRLVFSTDLGDPTADLKILFRLENLDGQAGRDAMPTFTEANFVITTIPEPSTFLTISSAGLLVAWSYARRRKRTQG